jgi:hypothetical protein
MARICNLLAFFEKKMKKDGKGVWGFHSQKIPGTI